VEFVELLRLIAVVVLMIGKLLIELEVIDVVVCVEVMGAVVALAVVVLMIGINVVAWVDVTVAVMALAVVVLMIGKLLEVIEVVVCVDITVVVLMRGKLLEVIDIVDAVMALVGTKTLVRWQKIHAKEGRIQISSCGCPAAPILLISFLRFEYDGTIVSTSPGLSIVIVNPGKVSSSFVVSVDA
jgi:hypothetical protein